ncbi:MAG: tetraacyldisaccharide 4'-kinase [Bacteroidales bacterium]|nr:tetraacyldisaccharide 4'-kinase [Bacteroidales bacterium]
MLRKVLLSPYYLTLSLRHLFFDKGWKKSFKASVPTVCVGNITVGGTGKTPHTEMILRTLLASDRWAYSNIAVLSRGYKRKSKGFQVVPRGGDADLYGDEPSQIARKFPLVTVAVDADRINGCSKLAPPSEIVVLDDAFQYRKLRARVNVILVDYNRPVKKDVLLPLGSLRDLPSRLKAADILIVTKCPAFLDQSERTSWAAGLGIKDYNPTTCTGHNKKGKEQYVFFTGIKYGEMTPVFPEDADNRFTYAKRLILFSGIAKDGPLVRYLGDKFSVVKHLRFPDHHRYTKSDMGRIRTAVRTEPTAIVCTTEKDAGRVTSCKSVPAELRSRLFCLPIEATFLTPEEQEIFTAALLRAVE